MAKTKNILSIIAFILSFVMVMITMPQTTIHKEMAKGIPTIEEYTILQEEALEYAKTLNFDKKDNDEDDNDGIKVSAEIKDDFIIITTSKEYRCKVRATYPIIKTADGAFKIDYDKGLYESIPKVSFGWLLLIWIMVHLLFKQGIYYILYFIVWSCMKIKEKIKEKIIIKKQKKDSKQKK